MQSAALPSTTLFPVSLQRIFLALVLIGGLGTQPAQTQTFRVLHAFTGNHDGGQPFAGLIFDQHGYLYGTTLEGGAYNLGVIFQMKPFHGQWTVGVLHSFRGAQFDVQGPAGDLTIGPNGSFYLFTSFGGNGSCQGGCGTVYNVRPPQNPCKTTTCEWATSILYSFQGHSDGAGPTDAPIFDSQGHLYGTTCCGGPANYGTVFQLTHTSSGWTESILHTFSGPDGVGPSGLALDAAGNLYGSTQAGGSDNNGTVYQLVPSGGGWSENLLYSFPDVNQSLPTPVILDPAGNIYGTTINEAGTIWQLARSGSQWQFGTLESSSANQLTMDAAGNLYAATWSGGSNHNGSIIKLTPSAGGWIYTDLYDFQDGDDGALPWGKLLIDSQGNLYGTASTGGAYGRGTVWELTP